MAVAAQTFSRDNLREWAFTIDNRRRVAANLAFSHSPGLAIMVDQMLGDFGGVNMRGAGHEVISSGESITVPVTLGSHSGAKAAAGPWDTHTVSPDDNTRVSTANWRFYNHALAVAEHEIGINAGRERVLGFLDTQTDNVIFSLADLVADHVYAGTGGTQLTGLDTLIAAAAGDVQGFTSATYTRWASRGLSAVGTAPASVSFASGSFAAQGISDMLTMFNNASEGLIRPTVILTDFATHERYHQALQPQQRFQGTASIADGTFLSLAFMSVPVIPDRKSPANTMFSVRVGRNHGINVTALRGFDFDFGDWKQSANQNVMVRPLKFTAQQVVANRQFGSNKMNSITD